MFSHGIILIGEIIWVEAYVMKGMVSCCEVILVELCWVHFY